MSESQAAPDEGAPAAGSMPEAAVDTRGPEAMARAKRFAERADRRAGGEAPPASGARPAAASARPAVTPAPRRAPARATAIPVQPLVLVASVIVAAVLGALLVGTSLPGWTVGLIIGAVSAALITVAGRQLG